MAVSCGPSGSRAARATRARSIRLQYRLMVIRLLLRAGADISFYLIAPRDAKSGASDHCRTPSLIRWCFRTMAAEFLRVSEIQTEASVYLTWTVGRKLHSMTNIKERAQNCGRFKLLSRPTTSASLLDTMVQARVHRV